MPSSRSTSVGSRSRRSHIVTGSTGAGMSPPFFVSAIETAET